MPEFRYRLEGVIHVPEGSKPCGEHGIQLPNGNVIKLWEACELIEIGADDQQDVYRDLNSDDLAELGINWDGDPCYFEEKIDG